MREYIWALEDELTAQSELAAEMRRTSELKADLAAN